MKIRVTRDAKHFKDINRLQAFVWGDYKDRELNRETFQEIVRDPCNFVVIVEDNGNIVACTILRIQQMLSRKVMIYDDLVVDPACRGKGVGKEIDRFIIELSKEQGCDCIECVIPAGNNAIARQHLKTGFVFRPQLSMGMILKTWEKK